MQITVSDERDEAPLQGPIRVGWLRTSDKVAVLYDPQERVSFRQTYRGHAKSAARCPAVIQLESRYFMVKGTFDLHLGFSGDDKGTPVLVNRAGAAGAVRSGKLNEVPTLVAEAKWRYPPPGRRCSCRCLMSSSPMSRSGSPSSTHLRITAASPYRARSPAGVFR